MADAVRFLASSESSCTTGATLPVDGGHTAPGRVRKVPPAPRRLARSPQRGTPHSPHRAKAQLRPVPGLPPGTPRARSPTLEPRFARLGREVPPRRRGARPPGGRRDFADTT
ncbi:hypothetical protein ACWEWG_39410 [Streptomyces sp. NPDC003758]